MERVAAEELVFDVLIMSISIPADVSHVLNNGLAAVTNCPKNNDHKSHIAYQTI